MIMLIVQNLTYSHSHKGVLFNQINLSVNRFDKIALVGPNGVGKSTLLKIIAGALQPETGSVETETKPYYIPQIFGQWNHLSIAQALRIDLKLRAYQEIIRGSTVEEHYTLLNEDWAIENRCKEALAYWGVSDLGLWKRLSELSGGQRTRVFLAGILIHEPELILLDEPTNHLDWAGRQLLYDYLQSSKSTFLAASHDRVLLQLFPSIFELSANSIRVYGGDYAHYTAQKQIESNALDQAMQNKEKALRKAREKQRKTMERQQRMDSRGKKKQTRAGMGKGMLDKMKNDAEKSTARLKNVHTQKMGELKKELRDIRLCAFDIEQMKFEFDSSCLHKGKKLFEAENINFRYKGRPYLWKSPLCFQIFSGERIAIQGKNGAGKSTLVKLILGELKADRGDIFQAGGNVVYIDQDYSLLDDRLKVYEQALLFNRTALLEHEIKIRLNRFLFSKEDWSRPCDTLSGGERMRLVLCCLNIAHQSPDLIVLDEPTNNLDLQNVDILTRAVNEYEGTLVVITHDKTFLEEVKIRRIINLERKPTGEEKE